MRKHFESTGDGCPTWYPYGADAQVIYMAAFYALEMMMVFIQMAALIACFAGREHNAVNQAVALKQVDGAVDRRDANGLGLDRALAISAFTGLFMYLRNGKWAVGTLDDIENEFSLPRLATDRGNTLFSVEAYRFTIGHW